MEQIQIPEQKRLNEIVFCKFIQKLLKVYNNPIAVIDMIDAIAKLADINMIILNSVISAILTNDRRYLANKKETVYLMKKSGIPVRKICRLAGVSPNTYYKIIEPSLFVEPKFNAAQYAEIIKFLDFFIDTFYYLEGYVR